MDALSGELTVRPATPADRGPVLAFCVDTFSWGDYIGEVWDDWLADPQGRLMVAELGGVAVGLQHVSFPAPGEVYLQGMRVDPAVRRRGVATALYEAGMALARERGARVVRLLTRVDNDIVQGMMVKHGFRRLLTFTDLRAPADLSAGPSPERAVTAELGDLWRLVEASEAYRLGEASYLWEWQAVGLTRERLQSHLERGEVFVAREQGRPAAAGLAASDPADPSVWLGPLHGRPEAMRKLALSLRVYATRVSASEVMAYVPRADGVVEALREAGYATATVHGVPDMDLYAKDLTAP